MEHEGYLLNFDVLVSSPTSKPVTLFFARGLSDLVGAISNEYRYTTRFRFRCQYTESPPALRREEIHLLPLSTKINRYTGTGIKIAEDEPVKRTYESAHLQ
jgi:hypothetical protein